LEAALSGALCDVIVEGVLRLVCAWHAKTVAEVQLVGADLAWMAEGTRKTTETFTLLCGTIFSITT